jgi:transcriptional regulator with PAS, ATPase and Fis domain
MILGESGTGKELAARAIHQASPRRERPFVAVNCATIPETLLENELFGHVRGAYTGADRSKKGLFEVAHGGTLFLDEIASMSQAMQIRLLRVLQDGELRPVGAPSSVRVDVRVIAASNQDLRAMVAAGTFREDLYYRLRVLQVNVPPLRERREDIPALVAHFLEKHDFKGVTVSPSALDVLVAYSWPGNVRELENEIRRASVVGGPAITEESLSRHIVESTQLLIGEESSFHDLGELVKAVESREIEKALQRSGGNKTRAATLLGISRFTLQRKLDKYGIQADEDS